MVSAAIKLSNGFHFKNKNRYLKRINFDKKMFKITSNFEEALYFKHIVKTVFSNYSFCKIFFN